MDSFTSMSLGLPIEAPKKKAKKGKGDPSKHLLKAKQAHAAGDHASAKRHALNAANALHALSQAAPENEAAESPAC